MSGLLVFGVVSPPAHQQFCLWWHSLGNDLVHFHLFFHDLKYVKQRLSAPQCAAECTPVVSVAQLQRSPCTSVMSTGTHRCVDPPRQGGGSTKHQPSGCIALSCVRVCACDHIEHAATNTHPRSNSRAVDFCKFRLHCVAPNTINLNSLGGEFFPLPQLASWTHVFRRNHTCNRKHRRFHTH